MKITETCLLEDRGIIYIEGSDAKGFLQNIVTNNLDFVSDNKSIYSSILTPQGKYLFDFILIKHKKGYLIDCEKNELENLIKTQSKDIRKLKRTDEKLTEVKFVNVQFDVKKYKEGEGVINDAIKDGVEIRRDFQTDSGLAEQEKTAHFYLGAPSAQQSILHGEFVQHRF